MKGKEYTLEELKLEASNFLKDKKEANETTFLNYRTSINYFLYFMEEHRSRFNTLTTENKEQVLNKFKNYLLNGFTYAVEGTERNVKIKASGVNTHITRIKTFFRKYLGLPVNDVKKLKVDKPKYKSLKPEEIKLLIAECSNKWSNEEIAVRNSTLIQFLFNTALRIEEALGIRLKEDFYKEDGSYYVRIHEKGKAKGVLTSILISEKTAELINSYVNIKKVPSDFIFSSVKASDNGKAKALSRQEFNRNIRELASYTDIKHNTNISKVVENNSSHVFRHSKATYLLNVKKEDVVTVKEILRHSSIDSTLIYLNPEEEAINKVRITNDIF